MSTPDFSFDYHEVVSNIFKIKNILFFFFYVFILMSACNILQTIGQNFCSRLPNRKIRILQIVTILTFSLRLGGIFYIFYKVISPPRELLFALLGSATVAIGLALKDTVSSLIAGITLIVDPPFQVGDRVKFKDLTGAINNIGLRAVRLKTSEGQLVTIPNMTFINEYVLCLNLGNMNLNTTIYFYIPVCSNILMAKGIIRDIIMTSRYLYLKEEVTIAVSQVWRGNLLSLELCVLAHVIDAKFEQKFITDMYIKITPALLAEKMTFPTMRS